MNSRQAEEKAAGYLAGLGWDVQREVKIRGRMVDVVGVRDGQIAMVEVRDAHGNMDMGIMHAMHQKEAADYSYLAMYDGIHKRARTVCRNLGVGLIQLDGAACEMLPAEHTAALESVRKKMLKTRPAERKTIRVQSPLYHILHTKSQVLILKLLFLNGTKEFHLNDIARRIGLSAPAVHKEMARLAGTDLILRRRQGSMMLYMINKGGIIYDEMRRIFLKYELFGEMLSAKFDKEDVRYAAIYGSFASGTEDVASDIDLFVVGGIHEDRLLGIVTRVEREIGREINFVLWTEKELGQKIRKKTPLIREIANAIIMITGDEDEFKRLAA